MTGLTVDGKVGEAPRVRMKTPLAIEDTTSAVIVEGSGAAIQVDQLFVLELSIIDARTGKTAVSQQAIAAKTSDDQLFPRLNDALIGVRQGSRVVLAATAADAFATGGTPPAGIRRDDPVVVVADVLAVPPAQNVPSVQGTPVPHQPFTPEIRSDRDVPTGIVFGNARPVSTAHVEVVVQGTGPIVKEHDLITVDYLGQRSGEPYPFESTFSKEPEVVAIGTGTAPAAWDEFLVGAHRGSRLVIFGPDGDGMIAWVVDVLGVS